MIEIHEGTAERLKAKSREQSSNLKLRIETEAENQVNARRLLRKISAAIHKEERRTRTRICYEISCQFYR